VQEQNCTEEELCSEWIWRTEHKKQKNRKVMCAEGSDADRATSMQQNSDESGKPLNEHYITVISFSSKDLYYSGWLGGAREDWCPQRFKWVLEHRELVLPSSWC
jgi:hypothetical protein